ncbi:MAG: HWE histidine kinase domain-containing protein [Mesorhizobium sp.]|nr:HWE histidine kinase domain-containing protein [Mesorhizobium sp.]
MNREEHHTGPGASTDEEVTAPSSASNLLRALKNAGVAVLLQDRDLRYVSAENAPPNWYRGSIIGLSDRNIFPPHEAERLRLAKLDVLRTGQAARLEIALSESDGTRWYDLWLDPESSGPDVVGIVTTAIEVSDQKRREQTLRTLLREVSHRSKNLLAIIQSIATQTGRYSGTLDEFLLRFRGRLQSLSSSQDLVTSSNWRGADLKQLVAGQVARYTANPGHNIVLSGVNPYLNPNAALHVGLALHELAVNSVSFGALSSPDSKVEISALPDGDGSIVFNWSERTPVGAEFAERRFGSVALERVVPASINSTAQLTIAAGRLDYRLVLPRDSFHPEPA